MLRACLERGSLRGVARIFALARQTVARWLSPPIQKLPQGEDTLLPAPADDVLELDEVWSCVLNKAGPRGVWTAVCRRTRHIGACAMGERSKAPCLRFCKAMPDHYKHGPPFRELWRASQQGFPAETPHGVGKEPGERAQLERWNTPLRQRMSHDVRQTFSFSKSDLAHQMVTKWFIVQ